MTRHDPGLVQAPIPASPVAARPTVLVIGGGASGVLLAAQVLRHGGGRVGVRLVEKGDLLGCGVAYSTRDPAHLLNTRVVNMSAFPHEPGHFLDWLGANAPEEADAQGFVSRVTYGRYMQDLLAPWAGHPALEILRGECKGLDPGDGAAPVVAQLEGGRRVAADLAVLATGHALPGAGGRSPAEALLDQPLQDPPEPGAETVLIVGSGLTMVDQVVSLLRAGHRGPVTAVSRRALLPQVHRPNAPVEWAAEEVPKGPRVAPLMRWLRERAREREAAGGDWRDVVDGLRPHLQAVWRALAPASRRSFLRHAAAFWEVHRHRMPPLSALALERAAAEGRFRLLRARFEGAEEDGDPGRGSGLVARLRGPGGEALHLPAGRIIDCRGIRRDPEAHATPLIAGLLAAGEARIDTLRIGLDVGPDCAVIDRDGHPSARLHAVGPAARAAFWEITAIPDIRAQADDLAARLVARLLS